MPAMRGFLAATLVVSLAPAASAVTVNDDDDGRRNCEHHTFWRIHRMSPRNFFVPRTRYIDGPGGSITVSVTREHEVTAFLETENERLKSITRPLRRGELGFAEADIAPVEPEEADAEAADTAAVDAGEVVHQLRRLGLPHLEQRHMVFTGHEYTREITDGMYGNMWYRVFGYRIGWSAWSVLGTCDRVKVAAGIASVPSRVEGWRYWETKHPMFKRRQISDK
ncbi:hypothetical protein [Nonomuraea insulae]|uniref:Uncharacterized protein n=1 Tax=Nonomuraea insulae TaxID=1616787 RepID=A0ABW1CHD5_9ACTN